MFAAGGDNQLAEFNAYQEGLASAQDGKYDQALELFQQHLQSQPDDGQAWNDAGTILFNAGHANEAISCLERARELTGQSGQVYLNLSEAYIKAGKPSKAAELFDKMADLQMLDSDLVNRFAETLARSGDARGAMEIMRKGNIFLSGERQTAAEPENNMGRPFRVAFFCGDDGPAFLQDIYKFAHEHFEVKIFAGQSEEHQKVQELMEWSDISWFEWCGDFAIVGSHLPKVCKVIVRLHRYEAYVDWAERVNWENVDTLITIGNHHVDKVLKRQVPGIASRTNMAPIPNGVDLEKFKFIERPRGKNIAFAANLRMVKNPMFLLQCMKKLNEIDKGYRVFIAGNTMQLEVENYLKHMTVALGLECVVSWAGWQENIDEWFADKHYIVSTSVIESQGMGILEGMARGLKPVVHNFPGAEQTFTDRYLFNTAEEFCEQILSPEYQPQQYRRYVEEKYPLTKQMKSIEEIFVALGAKTSVLAS
ncbi:MAG TPA: glycosyltransferase [Phycisphaerales bacterium]|nr:glycosyltransferase [Phycisphaerales bacterium]